MSQFENRVPLKPVLGGVGSVAFLHYRKTKSAVFVVIDVFFAYKGSSFRTYFMKCPVKFFFYFRTGLIFGSNSPRVSGVSVSVCVWGGGGAWGGFQGM